jgi:hypothetical protein
LRSVAAGSHAGQSAAAVGAPLRTAAPPCLGADRRQHQPRHYAPALITGSTTRAAVTSAGRWLRDSQQRDALRPSDIMVDHSIMLTHAMLPSIACCCCDES